MFYSSTDIQENRNKSCLLSKCSNFSCQKESNEGEQSQVASIAVITSTTAICRRQGENRSTAVLRAAPATGSKVAEHP